MGLSTFHQEILPTINAAPAVEYGIIHAQTRSDELFEDMQQQLRKMLDLIDTISNIPIITTTMGEPNATVSPFIQPATPVEPDVTPNFPSAPAGPVTGSVGTITLSTAPTFTATEPTINNITPPSALSKTAPAAIVLPDRDVPVAPSDALPVAPTARELTLPSAPSIIAINFDGVIPGALAPPPTTQFNWTNQSYQSTLLDTLKTKLYDLVLNARQTGLLPAIEQQIWDRGRERTAAEERRLKASSRRQFAALGWNMPQGDEYLLLRDSAEKAVTNDITESRSIAIAQAELEQKNLQFSIQSAISLEGELIDLHNAEQQRLFEAARYTIEAAIQLYGLEVSYFNANVTMYETQARVFQARIQAQLTQVEVYKAQLEGQRLISDLNRQDIDIYRAKIDAVVATFELYKSKLEGVKILLESDSLKLQQFEASVRTFAEEVRAKSLEYEGYRAQLDGEKIKVDMYNGLSSAFRNTIEGFKIETDAKIAKQNSDIKIAYDVPLQISLQQTEIFKSVIAAESGRLKSLTDIFETRGSVFENLVKGEASRVEAEVSIYENEVKKLIASANINIEALKASLSTLLTKTEMVIGVQKTIAQIEAQLLASYSSAVSYSAGINSTSSISDSHGIQFNYSESTTV